MGVDIVEIDVQRTSDGQLVILHDGTVDRTTNGKGFVKDMSLEAIKKLRLRNAQGRVTYHTVPTLEEAMLVLKGKAMVNLDKCYEYINEAYPILVKTGTVDHAIFKGYWLEVAKVKQDYGHLLKNIFYMAMVKLDDPQAGKRIDDFQTELMPVAFELGFTQDTARVFRKLGSIKRNGSRVWINSLWASQNAGHDDDTAEQGNLKDSYDWIIQAGANIIQTDRPAALLAYLRERKLHR
jgi:glycerophosphoryl diester phosphodiesterase